MSNLLMLAEALIEDLARSTENSVNKRDLETLRSRFAHEGLSFLTITLPNFSADFFTALERGKVESDLFLGWRKKQCLPAFLQGFTRLVFDTKTGRVLDNASITALSAIRQIGSFFKKIKLPCTTSREQAAVDKYVRTDETLDSVFCNLSKFDIERFTEVSSVLCNHLFWDFDPEELVPYHGPGATADYRRGNQKYDPDDLRVFEGLLDYFPLGHGFLWNSEESYNRDDSSSVNVIKSKPPVRVTTVPKTLKTPRVIAMEPTTTLQCQQALKKYVVRKLESCSPTRGHINFSSQEINKRLAKSASEDRRLATLDLSEASDRVHNELVKLMFYSNPLLSDAVQKTRTDVAILPNESHIVLQKYASMGSALCFPVESLFFYIVILIGRINAAEARERRPLPITLSLIKALTRDIYVYGDDLIVPNDEFGYVSDALHRYGSVVGQNKSFYLSYFRESCGMDAYKGVDITPVYMRQLPPVRRAQPAELISTVETANQCYKKGLAGTAQALRSCVERVVGNLPTFDTVDHEGLGWAWGLCRCRTRYNRRLQRAEVHTLVPSARVEKDPCRGYPALLKCLLQLEMRQAEKSSPFIFSTILNLPAPKPKEHLEESEIRFSTTLRWKWVARR